MSAGDAATASLRANWPNGAHLLVYFLEAMLAADQIQSVEDMGREAIDIFAEKINQCIRDVRRQWINPEGAEIVAKKHGLPVEEVRERHKAAKKYMTPVMEQAKNLAANLVKRLRNDRLRGETLAYLRLWYDSVRQDNLSKREAAISLQGYLAGGGDFLKTASDGVSRGILEAMERGLYETRQGDDWPSAGNISKYKDKDGKESLETWRHYLAPAKVASRADSLLPMPDIEARAIEAIERYRKSLGDLDSDLMAFAMAEYAKKARRPGDEVVIVLDELMEALGYPKQTGGAGGRAYRATDKRFVRKRFERLSDGYLAISRAMNKGKGRALDIQSQVMVITNRIGQADLDGRVTEWERCTIVMGKAWTVRLFEDKGRQLALLQAKALQYHPERQKLEKRLLKRLSWYWRLNRNHAQAVRTVFDWLTEDVGDERVRNDERFERRDAERLEEAFDRLKADGQIAAWAYADGQEKVTGSGNLPRGWLERWLEREIVVEIPEGLRSAEITEGLRSANQAEFKAAPKLPGRQSNAGPLHQEQASPDLPARFRQFRKTLGVTQMAAGKATGIHYSTLSKIEAGKQTPTPAHVRAMEAWMRDMKNRPDVRAETVGT